MIDPVSELRTDAGRCHHCPAWQWWRDRTPHPDAKLERPKRAGQGDYATNAAMLLAPALGAAPREIAGRLGEELTDRLGSTLTGYEVAGPGFLNLVLSDDWHRDALRVGARAGGERFGAGGAPAPERILLEFVSANPTGPARRRQRPPRRLRRLARPDPASTTATRSTASTTSTTPARRSVVSANRFGPGRSARNRPRTATRAITSPTSPPRSTAPPMSRSTST